MILYASGSTLSPVAARLGSSEKVGHARSASRLMFTQPACPFEFFKGPFTTASVSSYDDFKPQQRALSTLDMAIEALNLAKERHWPRLGVLEYSSNLVFTDYRTCRVLFYFCTL